MAYEKKDMSGTLFRNERKETDKHPDWAGYIVIGGVEYWLNGWEKNGSKGLFFSLAAKPKEERAKEVRGSYQGRQPNEPAPNEDGEIPF